MDKNIETQLASFMAGLEKSRPDILYLIPDKKRREEVVSATKTIAKYVLNSDPEAKITLTPDELTGTCAELCITSDYIEYPISEDFMQAIQNAQNVEIYPHENGKIQINFSFEKVFKRVK